MKLSQLSLADYNQLDSIPVINQDLSASGFTPVANTYYRHTGATTDTFTQGVIYLYDTAYHKLGESGGGGIPDVKVNDTSVVTDGVANIPPASESISGVVTNDTQTFSGLKTFNDNIQMKGSYIAIRSRSVGNTIYIGRYSDTSGEAGISTAASNTKTVMNYVLYGHGKTLSSSSSDCSYIQISPKGRDAIVRYHNTYGISYAMFAPQSWSSGTSGSLTLTEGGTYQFYSGSGAMIINYTLLYVELGKDSIAYAGKNVQLEIDTNNVVHIYDMSQEQPVEKTITLKYRRIGL